MKRITFESLLISQSNKPTLVFGLLVFITARVSLPVYITTPTADPAARTVLAHKQFSAERGSSGSPWSNKPDSWWVI